MNTGIRISMLMLTFFVSFSAFAQNSTFVIVHGAWGGAWQFKNTATKLEESGNTVYRVNLTGLGERYHLGGNHVNLNTHIADVVNTILFEQLDNIILMGHSYGGMVITGVADSLSDRIQKLIYLDALIPEDGESAFDLVRQTQETGTTRVIDGAYIIPFWVKDTNAFPRDVPHPIATFQSKLSLQNPYRLMIPTTYIFTYEEEKGGKEKDMFFPFAQRAKQYGWKVVDFEADHNPQIAKLDELVSLLLNER